MIKEDQLPELDSDVDGGPACRGLWDDLEGVLEEEEGTARPWTPPYSEVEETLRAVSAGR